MNSTLVIEIGYGKYLVINPVDAADMLRILQRAKVMKGETYGDSAFRPMDETPTAQVLSRVSTWDAQYTPEATPEEATEHEKELPL